MQRHPLHTIAQALYYDDGFGKTNVAIKIGQVGRRAPIFQCYVFQCHSEVSCQRMNESRKYLQLCHSVNVGTAWCGQCCTQSFIEACSALLVCNIHENDIHVKQIIGQTNYNLIACLKIYAATGNSFIINLEYHLYFLHTQKQPSLHL